MEAELATVAARLRGGYAEKLFEWRDQHGSSADGVIPKRGPRVFAPLFHSHTQPELDRASSSRDLDWKALLHSVFRRYAGELVVQGRLLNQDELEVYRFARRREHRPILQNESDGIIVVALPTAAMRFIVHCQDAPASRIGAVVTARLAKIHARVLSTVSSTLPVVSYRSDQSAEAAVWACETVTAQDLVAMDSVLGFDVDQFISTTSRQRRHIKASVSRRPRAGTGDDDDEDDHHNDDGNDRNCANHTIVRDATFSDLRGVNRMMDASGISPMQWAAMLTSSRADSVNRDTLEHDPWSFVSLGNAQKTMWSQERVMRGDALRAKSRLKDALAEYTSAIRLDDANVDALVKRGQALLELRQYDDAIRDFESVTVINPTHAAALHGLLQAKGKLGHSKHVVVKAPTRSRSRSRHDAKRGRADRGEGNRSRECVDADEKDDAASVLESDRLRRLLEEDERQRKQFRRKSRSRRDPSSGSESSSSTTDSDTSDYSKHSRRKRSKSRKKSKKKKKSTKRRKHASRSRDDERNRRKRSRSYDSSAGSSSGSEQGGRRHKRRSHRVRSRSRSRSQSRRRGDGRASRSASIAAKQDPHNDDQLHPILDTN